MAKSKFKHKDKLIQSAIKHFSLYGYQQASLNQIIEEARISKGSFYFHFKNKQDLYIYIFDLVATKKQEYFAQHLKPEDLEGMDIFETLKTQSKVGLQFAADYPHYYRLGLKFFQEKDEQIYRIVKERFAGNYQDYFIPIIKEAIANNELRPDFDPQQITMLLVYLLSKFDEIFSPYINFRHLDKIMDLFDKYIDFIKYGLAKRKEG